MVHVYLLNHIWGIGTNEIPSTFNYVVLRHLFLGFYSFQKVLLELKTYTIVHDSLDI